MLNDINELDVYFPHEKPFGPTNAANIDDETVFSMLLESNNRIVDQFKSNRSLIIGRKGSGKTSFLRGYAKYRIQESINTANTFSEIVSSIEGKSKEFIFVEKVSQLWDHIFTLCAFRGICNNLKEPAKEIAIIRDYCGEHNLADGEAIEDWLWKLVRIAKDKIKSEKISSVAAVISEIAGNDYEATKRAALNALAANKECAIILVDSLEQYPVDIAEVAHAMSGLLHCVGEFNERHRWIKVRLCLPAEMYHSFCEISANPLKDFSQRITLHWHPKELLKIAASRFQIYLKLQHRGLKYIEYSDKLTASEFLKQFMPRQILNGIGGPEDPISYILRHTQLMPRQLLRILNSIFREAYSSELRSFPIIDRASIIAGIKKEEVYLVEEVCSAFHTRYRSLRHVCENTISSLPLVFDAGTLHNAFNQSGKKYFGSDDFDDFKRMLIEAAVIGRVITEKKESNYVHGMFEYTAAHKLITSSEDQLCIHPIFAEVFHYKKSEGDKPVYPYGTNPDSDDYREF
jgi:hypothetical protein